jgi:two-component system NtrC family sensor kinase
MRQLQKVASLDFLDILDAKGNVVYRTQNEKQTGDSLADNLLVAQAVKTQKLAAGSLILSADALKREGKELAALAVFELQPTAAARPTKDQRRADGLAMAAVAPIRDDKNQLIGFLYGGNLLNRREPLVDTIRDEVFPSHDAPPHGTVTIFQDDLRIATNVIAKDGSRAVGTRMSEAVYREVVEQGKTWSAPAFVVNDWYITAYEPIRNCQQKIIGAIYVGILQAPFTAMQTAVISRFLAMMVLTTAASLLLIFVGAVITMWPISRIVKMSKRVIAGDYSARVEIRPPGDMGILCQAIDEMAGAVAEREKKLQLAVRQQATRTEKLASIGRLAAGVAHEINNPLTGVLTFAHLMRDKSNMDDQDREDLDLIIHETTRAADIVRGLLDFARERPVLMEPLLINDVVHRTVRLIVNQKKFENIAIEELLQDDLPQVCGDMNQLQQVLLNLSLNACTAMPNGGTLAIRTLTVDGEVLVKVTDTGVGIKPELLDRIFEPFFTTQDVGKGTGLGLSVTFGIIEQHHGDLEVESEEGKGSTFTIHLPALP